MIQHQRPKTSEPQVPSATFVEKLLRWTCVVNQAKISAGIKINASQLTLSLAHAAVSRGLTKHAMQVAQPLAGDPRICKIAHVTFYIATSRLMKVPNGPWKETTVPRD